MKLRGSAKQHLRHGDFTKFFTQITGHQIDRSEAEMSSTRGLKGKVSVRTMCLRMHKSWGSMTQPKSRLYIRQIGLSCDSPCHLSGIEGHCWLDFVQPYSLYHRRHLQLARRQGFEPCLASSCVSKKQVYGTDMNAVRREYVCGLHTLVDLTTSQSHKPQQHWKMYRIHHLRSSV